MRLFLVLFYALSFSVLVNAQSPKLDVKWGDFHKKPGTYLSLFEVIGHDDDHYYLNMQPNKKGGTLLKFDLRHNLVSSKPIDLAYEGDELKPRNFFKTAAGMFSYMPDYDKESKSLNIFVAPFDKGEFGEVKKAYSYNYKAEFNYFWLGPNFDSYSTDNDVNSLEGLTLSSNRKYAVFTNSFSTKENEEEEKIKFVVFDENMDLLWDKDQSFNDKGEDVSIRDVLISDEGEVFFIARIFIENSEKSTKDDSVEFKLFHLTKEGISETPITLEGDVFITNIGFFEQEGSEDLYFSGLYSDRNINGINGTFFGKMNVESKSMEVNQHKFNIDFVRNFRKKKEKAIEDDDVGVSFFFTLRHSISHMDNTFSTIIEARLVRVKEGKYYSYLSGDIIIPRYSRGGELLSLENVNKNFVSRTLVHSSYSLNSFNNKIYLIFNDKKDDSKNDTDLCIIGKDGKIENRYTIFTKKETDSYFAPYFSFRKDDTLILCGMSGWFKKYKFGTLKLD